MKAECTAVNKNNGDLDYAFAAPKHCAWRITPLGGHGANI